MQDRWLSVEEIAEYLGGSKDTIYGWVSSKGMPGHKVGRFWKFKKEAVDAWVQSGGAEADSADDATEMGASHQPSGTRAMRGHRGRRTQ